MQSKCQHNNPLIYESPSVTCNGQRGLPIDLNDMTSPYQVALFDLSGTFLNRDIAAARVRCSTFLVSNPIIEGDRTLPELSCCGVLSDGNAIVREDAFVQTSVVVHV